MPSPREVQNLGLKFYLEGLSEYPTETCINTPLMPSIPDIKQLSIEAVVQMAGIDK